jgi:aminoethylphosphonate catabolism LysR family transcriptional regulator
MNYSQIKAFHAVALCGGFSAAAKQMGLTQPALSEQVRKLEQTHDTLLFRREQRRVFLTKAGEELFLLTRQFFEGEERIAEFLTHSRRRIDGTLRIVADSAMHVTDAISRFRAAHPKAFVTVHTGNTEDVLVRLRNYDAEIGIVGNHHPASDIEEVDIGSSDIAVLCSIDAFGELGDKMAFADLARFPLVFREPGSRTRQSIDEQSRRCGVKLRPSLEVDGREAMREIVASGAGLGFVSLQERGHDPRLRVIRFSDADLTMNETVVFLKMRKDLPAIRAFLRCL